MLPVLFPVHPRTARMLEQFGLHNRPAEDPRLTLIEPLGYIDFLNLQMNAKLVMTDSGGIQEETTVLGVPCMTLRKTTERPITVREGTNVIVGDDAQRITEEAANILDSGGKGGRCPELWDGRAAERIVRMLATDS